MRRLIGWRGWVIDAYFKHWIALNSCKQQLWIKHPKKQLRILVYLITGYCCLNNHLHRMRLATSPVCASRQLKKETFHFVCVCPTLAALRTRIFGKPIMNASEFTEVLASAILGFAFQSGIFRDKLLTQHPKPI
jgi:hypothetical protein